MVICLISATCKSSGAVCGTGRCPGLSVGLCTEPTSLGRVVAAELRQRGLLGPCLLSRFKELNTDVSGIRRPGQRGLGRRICGCLQLSCSRQHLGAFVTKCVLSFSQPGQLTLVFSSVEHGSSEIYPKVLNVSHCLWSLCKALLKWLKWTWKEDTGTGPAGKTSL